MTQSLKKLPKKIQIVVQNENKLTSNLTPTPTKIDTGLINLAKAKQLKVDDFVFCCDSLTTHDYVIASFKKRFKYCMELSNICTTLEERKELVEATTDAAKTWYHEDDHEAGCSGI